MELNHSCGNTQETNFAARNVLYVKVFVHNMKNVSFTDMWRFFFSFHRIFHRK